jgi:diguanylate cyclase (GGDEF)-like protein
LLIERLETLIRANTRERSPFALLHLDLVRFKVVKYSLGHQLAEQLLLTAIERLQACLPREIMLARIGTDEFAIVIEHVRNLDEAIQFTETIQQEFAFPFDLGNHSVFVKIKAGLVWSATCQTPEELLQAADIAMHQSRQSKGTNYAVFEPAMQAEAVRRLQLDSDMHRALEQQEFQLYYQPIVAIDTQQLVGFEALIRWQQRHEWISPAAFIPLAEETGFIISLGEWILRQACWQMQQWCRNLAIAPSDYVTVNVSAVQLMQPGFVESVDRILSQTQLPPQQLKLEVTETAVMENARQVSRVLEQLQERQIGLCIDDFGTGYSSLSYLHAFPFDTLKIDRSFVSNLDENSKSFELIHTIVLLARNLEMDIVAEGVETVEQLRQLEKFGCDRAQGYLFSRPLSCFQIEQMGGEGGTVWKFPTDG